MCHLSMKLSDKFDPNQMYTSDKIVAKHISVKETLIKLDLEQAREQNIPPLNKQSEALLGKCNATDE